MTAQHIPITQFQNVEKCDYWSVAVNAKDAFKLVRTEWSCRFLIWYLSISSSLSQYITNNIIALNLGITYTTYLNIARIFVVERQLSRPFWNYNSGWAITKRLINAYFFTVIRYCYSTAFEISMVICTKKMMNTFMLYNIK